MKEFLEYERKIIVESIKKNGNSDARSKQLKYIDTMLEDNNISALDHYIEDMYLLKTHLWIIYRAYIDLLKFDELGIKDNKYKDYKKKKLSEFEKLKPFMDIDMESRPIKLIFPDSPSEIRKKLWRSFRDINYPDEMIKRIMAVIPLNRRNKPTGFKDRPENVHIFTQAIRIIP